MSTSTTPESTRLSHARDLSRPGFYAKLVLMMLVNAFGLYGILASYGQQEWGVLVFLIITLIAVDYVYFSKRALPAKYLVPGVVFLIVFQVYVMADTAVVAFTNYGDGHMEGKAPAITQILKSSDRRVEGTSTYPVAVAERGGELLLAIADGDTIKAGSATTPLQEADGAKAAGKVTEVAGAKVLTLAEIQQRQKEVLELRVSISENPDDGWLRTDNAVMAYVAKSSLTYDAAADSFTNTEGKVFKADESRGLFVADDGESLSPGWRVSVGLSNFATMFTDSRFAGPFVGSLAWTFAFSILSVLSTFALGLLLAVVYNDARVKGRTLLRGLFILPYAFPAFLAALLWRGLLNQDFGYINSVLLGGANIPWLTDGNLAKFAILAVNLWLGFPYMFLVATGALQAVPSELTEASIMDGAGPWRRFWRITLPLLLVSLAPLLIASFAFNFNNFSLIYMLTDGGPNYPDLPFPVGETDILITVVYAIAFESGNRQYGLASAMSIVIFVVVGIISWLGFRQTRKLEEMV